MINIFLILLLIHYCGLLILKPKNNTLNCGIFGWAGKTPNKFNKDKFDKLGISNIDRGKSSCGISYDGDVFIGINARKLYNDFIVDEEIKPIKFPVVIGHTRQASVGTTVNVHNAHPFAYGENGEYEFIGCHNGTLYNKEEIADKFEITLKENYKEYNSNLKEMVTSEREKIDSEILLECIYKSKNFKVLSDYFGTAALMFTNLNESNIVYLFRGESKLHSYSKDTDDERPLYIYKENKNSMYISSLENALRTIGGNDDNIVKLDTNIVYKITDGNFADAEKIEITRINAQQTQKPSTKSYYPGRHENYIDYGNDWDDHGYFVEDCRSKKNQGVMSLLPHIRTESRIAQAKRERVERIEKKEEINIYTEQTVAKQNEYGSTIYFNKLRFYRNGHAITGIYTWVHEFGYFYLGESLKVAEEKFWFVVDKPLINGVFKTLEEHPNEYVPFKSQNIINPGLFFFVEGAQIRTSIDYAVMLQKWKILPKGEYLSFVELSHITTHPIINLNHQYKDIDAQCITYNGKIFSGKISPLGSEKNYEIYVGCLKSTTLSTYYQFSSKKLSGTLFENNLPMKVDMEITEQNDDILLAELIENEEIQDELVLEIINEEFTDPLQDFQNIRTKMMEFSESTAAIKVINFIDITFDNLKKITKS